MNGHRRQPILGRFGLIFWPFDQQPLFFAWEPKPLLVTMRRPHPQGGEARGQFGVAPLTPEHRAPSVCGQRFSQSLQTERCTARHTLPACRRTPDFVFGLGRHRPRAGYPHRGDRLHPHTVLQLHPLQRFTPRRFVAIPRIRQHNAVGNSRGFSRADLLQRELGLGLKLQLLWHTGFFSPPPILSPRLRQIQPQVHRHTATFAGQRQTHRHLTIVLLAQLPAILACYAHRMDSFFRKSGVVHDPIKTALRSKLGRDPIAHTLKNRFVRPLRLRHQVMQRLMFRAHMQRIGMRRQRFHALAFKRQHQPSTVIGKTTVAIAVTQCFAKLFDVVFKFTQLGHGNSPPARISMHNTMNLLTQ